MERKLFYKKLFVFALPWILTALLICSISPSDKFRFLYLKNDCGPQPLWLYKHLCLDTEKIDLAFFGSSHTLRGINDSLLTSTDLRAANFGYCRFGRDIQYELFRRALKGKKLKTAFFEITETEPSYSHPVYTVLGESSDIFAPSLIYNQDFYKNRADAFLLRLSYLRSKIYNAETNLVLNDLDPFGFVKNNATADAAYLEKQKKEKLKDLQDYNGEAIGRKAELSFSANYFSKIKKLAEKNNCKVYFIYLPAYGNEVKNSLDSAFYKPYFKTLLPPDSILNNTANWQDEAHFNNAGAAKLSEWISVQLKNN